MQYVGPICTIYLYKVSFGQGSPKGAWGVRRSGLQAPGFEG